MTTEEEVKRQLMDGIIACLSEFGIELYYPAFTERDAEPNTHYLVPKGHKGPRVCHIDLDMFRNDGRLNWCYHLHVPLEKRAYLNIGRPDSMEILADAIKYCCKNWRNLSSSCPKCPAHKLVD